MDRRLHENLLNDTNELRRLISSFSTDSIAGSCAAYVFTRIGAESDKPSELSSQFRQLFFLLGIMLTTQEPAQPRPLDKPAWQKVVGLLEKIFGIYAYMFWPTPEELPTLTKEWRDAREVAMPAFLHHFNTTLLASKEQISDRVTNYLSPFDDYLSESIGISASDTLNVAAWIGRHLQAQSDDLTDAGEKTQHDKLAIETRAAAEGWDESRFWEEARKREAVTHHTERFATGIQNLFKIRRETIETEFGAGTANTFWELFVSRRGEVSEFTYITERNVAEERPLFEVEPGVAHCPQINALYFAVLNTGEQRLLNSPIKDAFLRRRDKTLEREVETILRQYFPPEAQFLAGVYETSDLQLEHDLVVLWNRLLFIVEAKASPPVEPFRDPDKAFARIRRAFRSDRGIQKAFDQANHLKKLVTSNDTVTLYDASQRAVRVIESGDIDEIYLICVTRDDFGAIATDLSLLLEKEDSESYPWVTNVFDLQAFLDAWSYFKWGPERFRQYLDERIQLHGKIFATDELDVAGYFIQHGDFHRLLELDADRIVLNTQYSDVFDKIYMTRHGGPEVKYAPVEPVITDIRKELFGEENPHESGDKIRSEPKLQRKTRQSKAYKNKIGRGARCPCNSGETYARCHGRRAK
jgi:hypothetical protein